MFTVVVTPPSSEPPSTAASRIASPKHSLIHHLSCAAPPSLSIQPDLAPMSTSPPLTNRAEMPDVANRQAIETAPAMLITPAAGHEDDSGLSAAALAMARQADANTRLGHTARPPADPSLAAAARADMQQPSAATAASTTEAAPMSALSPATSAPASPRQSMFGSWLSLSVIPPSPRTSLSAFTPTGRPRPSPLSPLLLFQSRSPPPPNASPPSPRTLNSPSYRHPSRLFPQSVHTDKHGYLLPPVANADLPRTLEGRGDSFWIDEVAVRRKEDERLRRGGRRGKGAVVGVGMVAAAARKKAQQSEVVRSEVGADGVGEGAGCVRGAGEDVDGVVDVVRVGDVDDLDDELQWHEVIDVVLQVGGAVAKEKQRRILERRKKGPHRRTLSTVELVHDNQEHPDAE